MVDVDSIIDPLLSFIPPPVAAVSTDAISVDTTVASVLNPVELLGKADMSHMKLPIEDSNQIVLPNEEPTLLVAQFPVQDGVEDALESVPVTEVEQLTLNSPGDDVSSSTVTTVEADSKEIIS